MPQAVGFAFALARGDIAFVRIGRRVIFSHGLHGAVGFIVALLVLESGANFSDKSRSSVKQNQSNPLSLASY